MIDVTSALASINILTAAVCFSIALTMVHGLFKRDMSYEASSMMSGIMLFAGGWGIHSLYFAVDKSLEAVGKDYLLKPIVEHTAWLTIIPLALVIIGGAFLLEPVLSRVFGKSYLVKYLSSMFFIWLFGAFIL